MKTKLYWILIITISLGCNTYNILGQSSTINPSGTIVASLEKTSALTSTIINTPTITPTHTITPTLTNTGITYQIKVLAVIPWTNTKIQVKKGNILTFTASGTAYTDNRVGGTGWGPDGNGGPCPPDCLMPGAPYVALIGTIGDGPAFMIGKSLTMDVQKDGVLYLAVNDNSIYYFDNHGYFIVDIIIR